MLSSTVHATARVQTGQRNTAMTGSLPRGRDRNGAYCAPTVPAEYGVAVTPAGSCSG